jgi:hypothetical protein
MNRILVFSFFSISLCSCSDKSLNTDQINSVNAFTIQYEELARDNITKSISIDQKIQLIEETLIELVTYKAPEFYVTRQESLISKIRILDSVCNHALNTITEIQSDLILQADPKAISSAVSMGHFNNLKEGKYYTIDDQGIFVLASPRTLTTLSRSSVTPSNDLLFNMETNTLTQRGLERIKEMRNCRKELTKLMSTYSGVREFDGKEYPYSYGLDGLRIELGDYSDQELADFENRLEKSLEKTVDPRDQNLIKLVYMTNTLPESTYIHDLEVPWLVGTFQNVPLSGAISILESIKSDVVFAKHVSFELIINKDFKKLPSEKTDDNRVDGSARTN